MTRQARLARWILTCVAVSLAWAGCENRLSDTTIPLEPGRVAPDFRAEDLTGQRFYLNATSGQIILLTFFATWCEPCKEEIPLLVELARNHQERVRIVCVVTDPENKGEALALTRALDIPYPMLIDEGRSIMKQWGVSRLPRSFLIDRRGRIRSVHGTLKQPDIERLTAQILQLSEEN